MNAPEWAREEIAQSYANQVEHRAVRLAVMHQLLVDGRLDDVSLRKLGRLLGVTHATIARDKALLIMVAERVADVLEALG